MVASGAGVRGLVMLSVNTSRYQLFGMCTTHNHLKLLSVSLNTKFKIKEAGNKPAFLIQYKLDTSASIKRVDWYIALLF